VADVGVDGFRFDLAVTLGRHQEHFTPYHAFLVALTTDPILRDTKLITEPWDLGPYGWRTGQFPAPMADWNDRFRNSVRTYWLTDAAALSKGAVGQSPADLGYRLAGSADLFGHGEVPGGAPPSPPSTSSRHTTASPPWTSCPTTASTTRRTGRRTGTARMTITRGTTAPRAS
jgi:Type II secretory pathway, pullulanase PulA and related glycosidases